MRNPHNLGSFLQVPYSSETACNIFGSQHVLLESRHIVGGHIKRVGWFAVFLVKRVG